MTSGPMLEISVNEFRKEIEMYKRLMLVVTCLLVVCVCSFSRDVLGSSPQTPGPQKDTLYFVPHTHWEGRFSSPAKIIFSQDW